MRETKRKILRKNLVLAIIYTIGGLVFALVALSGIVAMLFSGTFLVVYDDNWNIIPAIRILRYSLYAVLFAVTIGGVFLFNYGATYLSQRWQKRFGRC